MNEIRVRRNLASNCILLQRSLFRESELTSFQSIFKIWIHRVIYSFGSDSFIVGIYYALSDTEIIYITGIFNAHSENQRNNGNSRFHSCIIVTKPIINGSER